MLKTWLAALVAAFVVSMTGMAAQAGTVAKAPLNAAAYCVKKGGVVQTRIPEYGTNDGNPLVLSGHREFCQFTSAKDGSQINVLLDTLHTQQPSLAALAYYAQDTRSCNGNPASCYCTLLGGAICLGASMRRAVVGSWKATRTTCGGLHLPGHVVDRFLGLAYHSAGIVRGKNLARVLRYPNPFTARARLGCLSRSISAPANTVRYKRKALAEPRKPCVLFTYACGK